MIIQNVPGVICYIDDIMVTGAGGRPSWNLGEILQRPEDHGFRLKKLKCTFLANSVKYLGHQIDQHMESEQFQAK